VHSLEIRLEVRRRLADGQSLRRVAAELGLAVQTVHRWSRLPADDLAHRPGRCWLCAGVPCPEPATYGYLLGQYLGDGYLVTSARVPKLRIACADDYPTIAAEVDAALLDLSGNLPGHVQCVGCSDQYSYWKHWPCLLPQHGPGRKHERPIVLAGWQRELMVADPWPLIRGLVHSDGCRAINRVVVNGKTYSYPRYFFSNTSSDILAIMGEALDLAGVAWRFNRPTSISVARRSAVAAMDARIGPKR
jgi:hypothetical protein